MAINYSNLTPTYYGAGSSVRSKVKSVWDSAPVAKTRAIVSTANKVSSAMANPWGAVTQTTPKVVSKAAPVVTAFSRGLSGKPMQSTAPVNPQMSMASKSNTALMSGNGAQYGNNPTNQPDPVPKPNNTVNSWMSGVNALNNRTAQFYNESEARQRALQQQRYQDTVGLQNEMFDNANNDLRGEIPRLDERFGKFEQGVRANMAEADQIGATQKTNAQTYTGDAQRTAMQNKRQTDAQREKQYAALGTIDSYGTGSFTQGNENADSEFNRNTQQRYDALSQNLAEIDRTVAGAKREALSLIDQERMKYEDTVRAINTQLRDNDVARRGAITEAYYATQEAINGISEQYEGLRIAQEQQKMSFEQEMEKLTAENTMPTVSDWFLKTGQPQTAEDLLFVKNNAAGATAYSKMLEGSRDSTAATEGKQAISSVVNELLGRGTENITGLVQSSWVPGSSAAYSKNLYEQLKSMLSLENRQKLKGSGAISDFEAKVLERAASALGTNLSNEDFTNELMKIQQILGGAGGQSVMSGNDPLGLGL